MSEKKFDCIIIGAGPAGITAALVLAQNGLNVAILERGDFPGAKNVTGGVLFSAILNKLIPDFWKTAPVERFVKKKKFVALGKEDSLSLEIQSPRFSEPPYNNSFTVLRAKFDGWYANLAESKGAKILSQTLVEDLIYKNGKVVGVKAGRNKLLADVVIVAEGANSLLARKANLRKDFLPTDFIIGVKEIIELPADLIQSRFNLNQTEGEAIEFFGQATRGIIGSGFLYTNRDSLSIGIGVRISNLAKEKIKIHDLLEEFKSHPYVKELIKDGITKEYAAHLIPEIGFDNLPDIYTDGLLLAGDAAGLVNFSLFQEGSNLAMASGKFAAETVIYAKEKNDFSKKGLSLYEEKLKNSFVFKNIKRYRKINKFIRKHPQFFSYYPQLAAELTADFFTVEDIDEKAKEKKIQSLFKKFKDNTFFIRLLLDLNSARRSLL